MKAAIYLCGHGPYREPRLIEMQHLRILRYCEALEPRGQEHWPLINAINMGWTVIYGKLH